MLQTDLEKRIMWTMIVLGVILMIVIRSFGNLVLSIFFGLTIVFFPFWLDTLVRFKLIPYLDSLNISNSRFDEEFPIGLKVLIWAFVGVAGSALWTVIVPLVFSLPLWVGSVARNLLGWESFRFFGTWHYGWMIAFLIQYIVNFFGGSVVGEESDISDRFEYP